jgi:tetratricopeptide (TPR) repeat protein
MTDRIRDRTGFRAPLSWIGGAVLCAGVAVCEPAAVAAVGPSCAAPVARIVSIEGDVRVAVSERDALRVAEVDEPLCAGYVVEVGARSRAALQLANETTLRLDQRSRLVLSGFSADEGGALALGRGALHVLTRTPRRFQVTTPFVNANVTGTEFTVRVDTAADVAVVSVMEGRVEARNESDMVVLAAGERAAGGRTGPLRKDIMVRARGSVDWALHYPAIFDCGLAAQIDGSGRRDPALDDAVAACRSGRFDAAIAALDKASDSRASRALTFKAGLLLGVGRIEEADAILSDVSRTDPAYGLPLALRAVASLVEGSPGSEARALDLATRAVALSPGSSPEAIALSYAHQAQGRLDAALADVLALPPERATAASWARLAELRLSVGDIEASRAAARRALELDGSLAKAHAMLGYADVLGTDLDAATAAFRRAIALDASDPLARLGLGLTRIRSGALEEGRRELEVAAILDPGSSLVRSYLGKAYYDEKRDALAAQEYELARSLDPNDPTPWLYGAILAHVSNRPVTALRDLDESTRRNDNRAVYRSRLLLDDDEAARGANRAALYADLGLERLSIAESASAVADNFTNDSAHRQLANSYVGLPRHDIARVSEALQAQVRQPITIAPIDPLLANDNLVIPRDIGPSRPGTNEYNQLYSRNQVRLQVDGIAGTRGTQGDQVLLTAIADRFAIGVSQLHYESDGFRDDNAVTKNAYDLFLQNELSPRMSLQLDVRRTDFTLLQPYFGFDPSLAFTARVEEHNDLARVGGRYVVDPASDWIWSVFYQDRTRIVSVVPDELAFTQDDTTTVSGELQYTGRFGAAQVTAGIAGVSETRNFPIEEGQIRTHATTAYVYVTVAVGDLPLRLIGGVSWDALRLTNSVFDDHVDRHRLDPKLGVVWSPTPATTVRAAAMSTVKRPFVASQTLEPTQVAGFNQFFTGFDTLFGDTDGTVSRRAAVAVDQRVGTDWHFGGEWTGRRLTVPNFNVGENEWHERTAYGYAYRTFGDRASRWQGALSVDYDYEKLRRPNLLTGSEGIVDVTTQRLQFGARAFDANGLTLRASTSYVRQSGSFSADLNAATFDQRDEGWITDVSLDYRLPSRYGTVGIGARNVFDTHLNVFETDPVNPRFATRRLVYARAQLLF